MGVLVAISIPIFTTQLEKAREATDQSNIRAAYAEVVAAALTDDQHDQTASVDLVQKDFTKWENTSGDIAGVSLTDLTPVSSPIEVKYTASTGKVTIGGKEAKSNAGVTAGSSTED